MIDLNGNTAIVTGAGRGIGRDIALSLAGQGADVVVLDVDIEGAKETARLIEEAGQGSIAVKCNIADYAEVQECVQEVLGWRDQVHILVNNAGITRDNLLLRMGEEEWDTVIKINLTGTFNMTKVVTKHMFKKRFGRVVNIASVIGQMGNAGQSNYAASKAGIIGFTKSVAKEFAPRGVTANAIAPGFIDTPMTAVLPEDVQQQMRRMIPLGRFGSGDDVANVVLFLVSELGAYVTGQVINCDGGMVMAR
jgi:3-oxoacyl-[acyl-carrier protein] reductase